MSAAPKKAVAKKFRYPVFVKPATLGSSVGMTKVAKAAAPKITVSVTVRIVAIWIIAVGIISVV